MAKKSNLSKFIYIGLWLLFFFVFELCTSFIRSFSIKFDNYIMYSKCFLLTLLVLYKRKDEFRSYFIALHLFYCGLLFLFNLDYMFSDKFISPAWTNDIMALVGAWSALLFYRSKQIISKIAILGLGISVLALLMYNFKYIIYFNNYNSFTYIRDIWVNPTLYSITDKNKEKIQLERNTIYIIDFWHTRCGYCFESFPELDNRNKNNTNPNIKYVSVNYPLNIDKENQAFERMEQYNYSFPVWQGSALIDSAFGIRVFPTIVAYRNDTILYKGNMERLDDFLETLK